MEKSNKSKIIVILGPTASGKSDIAVKLAKKFNGEVVSADSRQVYKGLDIGTGKITPDTKNFGTGQAKKKFVFTHKRDPHYLIDVVSPHRRFTASDYKELAEKAIGEILDKNKIPIVCGGTGFYIDALLGDKQIPEVPPNLKLRKELEKKSTEELFEILKRLDKERVKNIDAKNPRRLIRAIEICKALGKVPPFRQSSAEQAKYEVLKIGIKIEDKKLKERINKRIEKWFRQGLLKEVQNLHKKGLSWKRMGEIGLEYKIVSLFLQNKIPKEDMKERMQIETSQYAKRQKQWFKNDKKINWFNPEEITEIEKCARSFLGFD
jgi:tRNA dimethylallyltransferase